jgi:hypothetical protein
MIKKNIVIPALFILFLTCLCSCAAPLAMQGLSSGVPVAFNSTARGKGDSAWFAHYDDVVQATLDAGQKLSFKLEKKTIGMDQSALNYIDDRVSKAKFPLNYHR